MSRICMFIHTDDHILEVGMPLEPFSDEGKVLERDDCEDGVRVRMFVERRLNSNNANMIRQY